MLKGKICSVIFIVTLTFLAILPVDSSTLKNRKFSEQSYKKIGVGSFGKSLKYKEYRALSDEKKNFEEGSENFGSNLRNYKIPDEQLHWKYVQPKGNYLEEINGKIIKDSRKEYLSRLKRNVESIGGNNFTEGEMKIGKKNHKKLKLAEAAITNKDLKNKGLSNVQKVGKYNAGDGKYLGKKKINRRHAIHSTKMKYLINRDGFKIDRFKRNVALTNERPLRTNSTDYYTQRKAVMERFYARQREIAERYTKQTISTPRNPFKYDLNTEIENNIVRTTTVKEDYPRFYNASRRIEEKDSYANVKNDIPSTTVTQNHFEQTTTRINFNQDDSKLGLETFSTNNNNIDKNTLDYYNIPAKCENASLSGNFPPKNRRKADAKCKDGRRGDIEKPDDSKNDRGSDDQRWGDCTGKLVYQHNLLLGLKGPSNLDAVFEVIIQGPICITCVEAIRYNETRAEVSLHSGGRGYEFAKLKLKGFENEGFSYIVKVWGVRKRDEDCRSIL